ncbi:ATP-dependent DNA helicase [Fervidobacterium thailandense]|uniref:AAA+ ATPase domain-containing protein n=1 Tax=Fervidobacterium thailandense TaxID=1008305 RepID=A0A1E3G2B7_9BACT|nr:AAA family ATPase [Fervidobacterium thailandense]ODN29993.1 hypothetical protein A4H02_07915 [Fervidobacterium thailandense]
MNLTKDQKEALEKIIKFLSSPSKQIFILTGYAGTGKTTLLSLVVEYLEKVGMTYALLAPTGKAAHVLKQKTGRKAFTIHKAIYDFQDIEIEQSGSNYEATRWDDEDEAETLDITLKFRLKNKEDFQADVYIIDEASLISDEKNGPKSNLVFGSGKLLSDLIKFTKGAKLILCGDPAQLPPVGSNESVALDEEYIRSKFGLVVEKAELREVVRIGEDNHLLKLLISLRKAIESEQYGNINIPEELCVCHSSIEDLVRKLFSAKDVSSVIITHTNEAVQYYNSLVHSKIFGDGQALHPNQNLLVYKNYYPSPELQLFNGELITVVDVGEIEIVDVSSKREDKVSYQNCTIRFFDFEKNRYEILRTKILLDFFHSEDPDLSPELYRKLFRVALLKNYELRNFNNELRKLEHELKKNAENAILKEKFRFLKKYFGRLLLSNPYFNPLLAKLGYAVTCHKAQGSEWENVIVDLATKNLAPGNEQFCRWLYTAFTRVKKDLFIVNCNVLNRFSRINVAPIKVESLDKISKCQEINDDRLADEKIVQSLNRYGFQILAFRKCHFRDRYELSCELGRARIDLLYDSKGFYTRLEITVSNEEVKQLMEQWVSELMASKDC